MSCVFFSEVTGEATHFLQLLLPVLSVLPGFSSVCIFQFLQEQRTAAVHYMRLLEEFEPELRPLSGMKHFLAHLLRSALTSGIPFKIVSHKLALRLPGPFSLASMDGACTN